MSLPAEDDHVVVNLYRWQWECSACGTVTDPLPPFEVWDNCDEGDALVVGHRCSGCRDWCSRPLLLTLEACVLPRREPDADDLAIADTLAQESLGEATRKIAERLE